MKRLLYIFSNTGEIVVPDRKRMNVQVWEGDMHGVAVLIPLTRQCPQYQLSLCMDRGDSHMLNIQW